MIDARTWAAMEKLRDLLRGRILDAAEAQEMEASLQRLIGIVRTAAPLYPRPAVWDE